MLGELPYGTDLPGQIRFFEDKQIAQVVEFDTIVKEGCTVAADVFNPKLRLGLNMYMICEPSSASLLAQAKTSTLTQGAALKAITSTSKTGQTYITNIWSCTW